MGLKGLQEKPAPRMSAEERRHQILDVAIRLFSQKGFRGTTTKEIALAAGVNEAIIFRHFATKKDLYSAILDQKACSPNTQEFETSVDDAMNRKDDRAVFETIALHILEKHDHDDTFLRLLFYSALERHELADMFFRNQITNRYRRLASYIKQRIADGAFRRVDPMTATHAFLGVIVHHAQINKFYGRDLLNISNRLAAQRFTDLFFSGVLAPRRRRNRLSGRTRRNPLD